MWRTIKRNKVVSPHVRVSSATRMRLTLIDAISFAFVPEVLRTPSNAIIKVPHIQVFVAIAADGKSQCE